MQDSYNSERSDAINRAIERAHAGRLDRRIFMRQLIAFGFTAMTAAAMADQAKAAAENQAAKTVNDGAAYDYIIVGAGSAGCVLANRLSADANATVLLIEAGGKDIDQDKIVQPLMWPANWGAETNYNYKTVPQKHAAGREIVFDRGKILGGSSAINAMFWQRSDPLDYRSWGEAGGSQWSVDAMLQSFRELETFRGKPSSYRGTAGKMPVGLLPTNHPYAKLYIEAGVELGMKHNPDFNGAGIEGVGFYDMNVDNGRRVSAAHAFVLPILDRSNLTLMTDTKVLKLVMNGDACSGVQVRHNGQIKSVRGGEIILSAGAVNSPELLLRSGIGASDDLKALGIPTAVNLPGVGRNFVDHVMVHNVVFTSKDKMPAPTGNTSESHALWKSDSSLDVPDLQLIFEQIPIGKANVPIDEGFSIIVGLVRPSSVGSVKLRDTDPDSAPLIDPNYLSTEADMKKLAKGVEMARELGNAKAFAGVRKAEVSPTKLGDGDLRKFIAENMATFWHPVGSCRLGKGPDAVVDQECRVHGARNLRVADASIMPRITTTNTNAPSMMIGQKAADLIMKTAKVDVGAAKR